MKSHKKNHWPSFENLPIEIQEKAFEEIREHDRRFGWWRDGTGNVDWGMILYMGVAMFVFIGWMIGTAVMCIIIATSSESDGVIFMAAIIWVILLPIGGKLGDYATNLIPNGRR